MKVTYIPDCNIYVDKCHRPIQIIYQQKDVFFSIDSNVTSVLLNNVNTTKQHEKTESYIKVIDGNELFRA